jgi:predicted metal-dependent phosphoesterase TrpH
VAESVIGSDRFDAPGDVVDRIDLHLHSNRSDGLLEPAAVIAAAQEAGLSAVALTDHDTLIGVEEAAEAAAEVGLPFVPGIEFSCYDDNGSTHMLGYFVDPGHAGFAEYLANARQLRVERAEKMVEKLNRLRVDVTLDDVKAQASEQGLIARPHVARALVAGGWVKDYNEAFYRFIAAGQPAYVPTWRLSPAEGIRRIQEAGGLAILAHGGKSHSESVIRGLVDAGLDGLETLHPEHGPYEVRRLRRLVEQHGLLESGGSDWHGPHDGRRGQLASQPVPYEWYVRLRDAAEERAGQ